MEMFVDFLKILMQGRPLYSWMFNVCLNRVVSETMVGIQRDELDSINVRHVAEGQGKDEAVHVRNEDIRERLLQKTEVV